MNPRKPYVLSVYALVQNENGHYLILKRSKDLEVFPGKWDLPGGKVDFGETLEQALYREVEEETGFSISVGAIAGEVKFELPAKKVISLVYESEGRVSEVNLSPEHEAYTWASLEQIKGMKDIPEHFRTFFERYGKETG